MKLLRSRLALALRCEMWHEPRLNPPDCGCPGLDGRCQQPRAERNAGRMRSILMRGCLAVVLASPARGAEIHTFTETGGGRTEGEFQRISGERVYIRKKDDGRLTSIKISSLTPADQSYVMAQVAAAAGIPAAASGAPTSGAAPTAGPAAPASAIDMNVTPVRKQATRSGDLDDTVQRLTFRIDLQNKDRSRPFMSCSATMMVFADDMKDINESIVVSKEDFAVDLPALKTMTHETEQKKLVYDDKGYKYGQRYAGYLLVLKDPGGNVVKAKASKPSYVKGADAALKLKPKDKFDRNFKFQGTGYLRD